MSDDFKQALTAGDKGVYIALHIQPGAKREGVTGLFGTALKIALNAPPVDGKANAALIKFLADKLALSKSALSLKSGECSRDKVIRISGKNIEEIISLLDK